LTNYANNAAVSILMAILPELAYETFTSRASLRRASGYAKTGAGENPNALAKGLGIALFANTGCDLLTN